ncbi:hypothetical protein [Algoriphagus boritolerans]|uniref:hypothetical protein n=1 Tax=Algoriphagus boritolerans TaxID=308111 RepID=UPI000AE5C817
MILKSFFLFCLLASLWFSAFAQTLPAGPKVQSIGGGLSKGIPTNGLEGLATKPDIPYLEELRQVHGLKKSYDSLRSEVKKLKEYAGQYHSGLGGEFTKSKRTGGAGKGCRVTSRYAGRAGDP